MTIRVVLADDHPMYRYGLSAVLDQADGIDVIASVGDGSALVGAVRDLSPDVVLTDLSMPGLDGVGAITQLLGLQPELPILALTMHEDDAHVFAALRAGARGYLVKGADGAEIVRAVYSVASGEAVYGGPVARRIVAFYSGRQVESPVARAFPDLTPREREVLELLAAGCRNHVSQVLAKLQVPDRTAAALKAHESGIRPGAD